MTRLSLVDEKYADVSAAHRELNQLSTLLLCATSEPGNPTYDFFLCHALTTSYAVRTVLPELPVEHAVPLVKAQWLLTLVVYCIQLRPQIRPELVEAVEVGDTTWERIKKEALIHRVGGEEVADTHYMKGTLDAYFGGGRLIQYSVENFGAVCKAVDG